MVATTAGMSLAALLSAVFGVMLAPMEQELGWTRAEISTGPAIVAVMGLFLATPAGALIDRWGARSCGIMVVMLSGFAIASMSAVGDRIWQWWAAWAVFGITGAFTSTVWMAPVSAAFKAGRGMAIAVTFSGTGISSALAPGIAEYFVVNHGWRSGFLALAVIWFTITLPLVLAFVPGQAALARAEARRIEAANPADAVPLAGLSVRGGLASPALYLLFFATLLSMFTAVAVMLNIVPILTFGGLTRIEAVGIAGSVGVASIVGRLIGGYLMDRFDVRRLAVGAILISLGLPAALLVAPDVLWAVFIGVMCAGLTLGVKLNAMVYLTGSHLGLRSFGLFYGIVSTATTIGAGLGPLAANYIYDVTGSYLPALWATIPGALGAAILILALGDAPDFSRRADPEPA